MGGVAYRSNPTWRTLRQLGRMDLDRVSGLYLSSSHRTGLLTMYSRMAVSSSSFRMTLTLPPTYPHS